MFSIERNGILNPLRFCPYYITFGHKKGPEQKFRLFDVLLKQTICKMKTLQVEVCIQQWFYEKQGARFMQILKFLV